MCLDSDKLEMFKEVLGNKLGVEQDQLRVKVHVGWGGPGASCGTVTWIKEMGNLRSL